ncbi:MAG: transketolase C-terminal domain-containing protein [Acidobacteriaceae bacterium]
MERQLRYLQALREALMQEMRNDPNVVVLGEDVRQSLRGITKGCLEEFGPDRILDTPISEAAFVGLGTGAAISGLRPVIEFQIGTLLYVAMDQLANQVQKLRYMTGGQAKIPVTYIVPGSGARPGLAGQHSDHLYSMLIHCGIKVLMPATPYDAKGLFTAAIREDDPVVLFAPSAVMGVRGVVPVEEISIPLGRAELRRIGTDVTVVASAPLLVETLKVATHMEQQGLSIEVFDPRSLLPFDHALLESSVAKTGRLIVFDDSNRTCGFAAEVAAYAGESLFQYLRAPIVRITRADLPVPFSTALDKQVLPNAEQLEHAIARVMRYNPRLQATTHG